MTDPIVLDLGGNGIQLIPEASSSAQFDLHGNGFAVKTGWIGPQNGFLVVDRNHDGKVNDITELFGNSSTDGFAALSALDSNGDGVVNASDPGFATLEVWQDSNGNGVTDPGELHSLADLGIASISLATTVQDQTVNGNVIGEIATFTRSNGSTGEIAEAFFDNNQLDSHYTGTFQLNPAVLTLPNLRGYGTVPDLYIAMSLDPTLLQMVQSLAGDSLIDAATFDQKITAIIYRWAGVDTVDPTTGGSFANGQQLAAIEKFMGESYAGSNGSAVPSESAEGVSLGKAWNTLFSEIKSRLLVQGPLSNLFAGVGYNFDTDGLSGSADLSLFVATAAQSAPTDRSAAIQYWAGMVPFIDTVAGDLGIAQSSYESKLETVFSAANLPFTLAEARAGAVHLGTSGNDVLTSGAGPQYFDGGAGNDTLIGNGLGDTFVFGHGYGHDTVIDNNASVNGGTDEVLFNADVNPSQVSLSRSGTSNDVTLTLDDGSSLTILNQFDPTSGFYFSEVEQFQFQDVNHTVWTAAQLSQLVIQGEEAAGAPTIYGFAGADTFDDSHGNATLVGGGGNDTFVFGLGYGHQVVDETDAINGRTGTLKLGAGIAPSAISLSLANGNADLVVTLPGGNDSVTIKNEFLYNYHGINQIQFADGTSWNLATIEQTLIQQEQASGASTIQGTSGADTFNSSLGGQTFIGNGGADTLVFGHGYGQDIFSETDFSNGKVATVLLNPDVAESQVNLAVNGSDLVLSLAGTSDTLTIASEFGGWYRGVNQIKFADGTTWNATQMAQIAVNDEIAAGNTVVAGTSYAETFNDSHGNVTLLGNGGADTFVFGHGYGHETVDVTDFSNGKVATVLLNPDVVESQVSLAVNGSDLVLSLAGTSDTLTIASEFGGWYRGVQQIKFADGTTWNPTQMAQIAVNDEIAAGNTVVAGTSYAETFNDSHGNVTLLGNGGADTFVFGHGYGHETVDVTDWSVGKEATILLNPDVAESQVNLAVNGSDLVLSLAGTSDTLTIASQFSGWYRGVQQIKFADGTSLSASQLSALKLGTSGNDTLAGTSGNDTFYSSAGTDTMTGGGGSDTYEIGTNLGQTTINNAVSGGTAASGKVNFLAGISDESLWFLQSGNDLQVDFLGTNEKTTLAGWFGSNPSAEVQSFMTADGMTLDSQVAQLVAAMATYSANNSGFNPSTATQMPTDSTLQNAIASAWHH